VGQFAFLAAAAAVKSFGTIRSAQAENAQLKVVQRQEEQAATDREVQRQRRLNAILGSQAASVAASGVALSGSVANLSIVDARRAAEDSLVDQISTGQRITALQMQRRSNTQGARIKVAGTILSTAASAYDSGLLKGGGK
jgi:hypothetical protein